jgi:thiol-disulfide isomerase/thioredoxin
MTYKAVLRPGIVVAVILALWLTAGSALAAGRVVEGNRGQEGKTFDLNSIVSQGQFTLVDFWSPYCGPCLKMAPYMEQLAARRSDLKVVKLNINRAGVQGIDWKSPLALQYNVKSVPFLIIFDKKGRKIAEGQQALQLFIDWAKKAGVLS